jgi:hypothetical protein
VVASVSTGHYFATPFAVLFALGYLYVAGMVAQEQFARRREVASSPAALWNGERASEPTVGTWSASAADERPLGDVAA